MSLAPHVLVVLLIMCATVIAWTPLTTTTAPKISGHACCDTGDGQRLLLFGGLKADRTATNELWLFQDEKWKQIQSKNEGPGPRMYAAAARLGNKIFVTGGWDPEAKGSGGSFKDDVYSIDDTTLEWTKHAPLPCGTVSRHTACTVGSRILLHTYNEGDEGMVVIEADGTSRVQPTTGDAPNGISMCCAVPLGDSAMIVFGGSTKKQEMSNAAYVLDTNNWQWRKLESQGTNVPTARASMCMAAMDESTCLVFGGAGVSKDGYQGGAGLCATDETWLLKVDGILADWTLFQEKESISPRPRVAASMNKVPGSQMRFLLVGGWDPATAETFEEPWVIEL